MRNLIKELLGISPDHEMDHTGECYMESQKEHAAKPAENAGGGGSGGSGGSGGYDLIIKVLEDKSKVLLKGSHAEVRDKIQAGEFVSVLVYFNDRGISVKNMFVTSIMYDEESFSVKVTYDKSESWDSGYAYIGEDDIIFG